MFFKKIKNMKDFLFLLFFLFVLTVFPQSCARRESGSEVKAVVTTSLLETIIKNVGGEKVSVTSIVPGGICPGHVDIKPRDIIAASGADLIIFHGWEKWIDNITADSGDLPPARKALNIKGNLMIPDNYIEGIKKTAAFLSAADKENAGLYERLAAEYIAEIKKLSSEFKREMPAFKNIKAISSNQQEEFLNWLGVDVVAVYGRPEDMNPAQWIEIIDLSREEGVSLAVDNLQSGANAAVQISKDIGAEHIVLSNFPLNGSYADTLKENIEKVRGVITE
jgi:ABC-type Zn uptake system ZnuABC Zn-binding protein ZnuA